MLSTLASFALVAAFVNPSLPALEPRPNIIFLLAEDLAANAVGYSGNQDVITPNIDKLASDGIRVTNFYDTTSICMASRCTMMTGLYEFRHGCNFDHGVDRKLYEGKSFTRPPNYGVEQGTHLSPQALTSRAATGYREWVNDFDDTAAKYCALITGVDAAVGMIRDELTREGLDKNTVIILTSDNGYNAGSHGFGDKVIPYEEGSRAPSWIHDSQ